jgi:hypothetical protein
MTEMGNVYSNIYLFNKSLIAKLANGRNVFALGAGDVHDALRMAVDEDH